MNSKFIYADEEDKCYGLAGMAIALNVWDKHTMIRHVSLDLDEPIAFTPDFFFTANPRFSAKLAWNEMLKEYQLLTGIVLGNVICRKVVRKRERLTNDFMREVYALVENEGREHCQLEPDEITIIFKKTSGYISDLFTDARVASLARQFASDLMERRTMSGNEIADEIDRLQ